MVNTKVATQKKKPKKVVERNIALVGQLMRYLLEKPQLLNSLPERFELVILPEDDPAIRLYNLSLLDIYGSQGKPIVFARLASSHESNFKRMRPNLYVPLTA